MNYFYNDQIDDMSRPNVFSLKQIKIIITIINYDLIGIKKMKTYKGRNINFYVITLG